MQATVFAALVLVLGIGVNAAHIQPARKVLPKLVLNDDLAAAIQNAEGLLTAQVSKSAKLVHLPLSAEDLELDNVFFHIDKVTSVELTNMKLNKAPAVEVFSVKPNLEFLNMKVELNLGSLEVGGSFEVANKAVLSVLPIISTGEFSVNIEDIKATGMVGLSLVEDSFVTINHDIKYEPQEVLLKVQYPTNNGIATSLNNEKDGIVVEQINRQLRYVLNKYIKKQLDEILVEISVNELIGDSDLEKSYRNHAKEVRVIANDYVDEVLLTVHDFVVESNLESIVIPDIDESFSKTILWVTWHGEFYTRDGHVANLGSLMRTADVSLEYDESTGAITVFGSLGLAQLDLGYGTYSAKFMGIGPSGSVGATVGSNSLFIKVSLIIATEPKIALEDLHIEYAKGINIQITGLGILDWLVSTIATWVVGMFNEQIVGSLDGLLLDVVQTMLPTVDPNKYFG